MRLHIIEDSVNDYSNKIKKCKDREIILTKLGKYETKKFFRWFYDTFKSEDIIKDYQNFIKLQDNIIELLLYQYECNLDVLIDHYSNETTWEDGYKNFKQFKHITQHALSFGPHRMTDQEKMIETAKKFKEMCNIHVKEARENPNSSYNRNKRVEELKKKKEEEAFARQQRDRQSYQRAYQNYQREEQRRKEQYRDFHNNEYRSSQYSNSRSGFSDDVKRAFLRLGIPRGGDVSLSIIKKAYKAKALENHPDRGGTTEAMAEINVAYETACRYFEDKRKNA